MARVKRGINSRKRHRRVLKQARGFYGSKSKIFRAAKPAVMRSLSSGLCWKKVAKRGGLQKTLDHQESNAGAKNERTLIQQAL